MLWLVWIKIFPSLSEPAHNHNIYLTTLVFLLCTACYRTMLFQLRFKTHMLNRAWAIYPSGKNLVCILATQKENLTAKSYLWKLHVYQERWSAFGCSGMWLVSEDFKAWTTWISAKSFIYTNEWKSSLNFDQYISFSNFSYCLPCNSYCYKLIGSTNNPLTDIFLYSHNLSA